MEVRWLPISAQLLAHCRLSCMPVRLPERVLVNSLDMQHVLWSSAGAASPRRLMDCTPCVKARCDAIICVGLYPHQVFARLCRCSCTPGIPYLPVMEHPTQQLLANYSAKCDVFTTSCGTNHLDIDLAGAFAGSHATGCRLYIGHCGITTCVRVRDTWSAAAQNTRRDETTHEKEEDRAETKHAECHAQRLQREAQDERYNLAGHGTHPQSQYRRK